MTPLRRIPNMQWYFLYFFVLEIYDQLITRQKSRKCINSIQKEFWINTFSFFLYFKFMWLNSRLVFEPLKPYRQASLILLIFKKLIFFFIFFKSTVNGLRRAIYNNIYFFGDYKSSENYMKYFLKMNLLWQL